MSSTRSYRLLVLFLFFICLSLCDARRLGPVEKKLEMSRTHLNTKKNEENVKPEAWSNASSSQTLEAPRSDKIDKLNDQSKRSDHGKVEGDGQNAKLDDEETSMASSKRVSRSWKVPQKKKKNRAREDHPSFNLDYMQPSTHPPHHN